MAGVVFPIVGLFVDGIMLGGVYLSCLQQKWVQIPFGGQCSALGWEDHPA